MRMLCCNSGSPPPDETVEFAIPGDAEALAAGRIKRALALALEASLPLAVLGCDNVALVVGLELPVLLAVELADGVQPCELDVVWDAALDGVLETVATWVRELDAVTRCDSVRVWVRV